MTREGLPTAPGPDPAAEMRGQAHGLLDELVDEFVARAYPIRALAVGEPPEVDYVVRLEVRRLGEVRLFRAAPSDGRRPRGSSRSDRPARTPERPGGPVRHLRSAEGDDAA